jgi:hypothetical protein
MFEVDRKFSSFEEWMLWTSKNSFFSDSRYSSELAQRIIGQGFVEPLTRLAVKPSDIVPEVSFFPTIVRLHSNGRFIGLDVGAAQ